MLLWYLWLPSHDWPTDELRRLAHPDDTITRSGVRRHGATNSCHTPSPSVVLVVRSFLIRGLPAPTDCLFASSSAYRGWWGHAKR